MKPPEYLDGAKVLLWDWSDGQLFGYVDYTHGAIASEIFGLAICPKKFTGLVVIRTGKWNKIQIMIL
ncbi:hypothetical protein A1343_02150 [Leptospira interrogans serovar Bataviae]|nr:hypothetical protein [Leptospira interrogans serovar Bataviae]OAM86005.1 hypothetical protein A1343_02150 [Leptospira interrogans serovar Bataviae]